MIAIFDEYNDALDYATDIHEYLTEHRPGYNADRWAFENKSDNEDLWMVKIPEDVKQYDKYEEKIKDYDDKIKYKVPKLPENWKNE